MIHFEWFIGLGSLLMLIVVWITYLYRIQNDITKKNNELKEKYFKVLGQKKSSEVRLGKIGENMAPFFTEWPYDPNKFRFLGSPIDGISFCEDEVVFVEIKTGKARLTDSQKRVKALVKAGKVRFVTFRVGEDRCTLKIEDKD